MTQRGMGRVQVSNPSTRESAGQRREQGAALGEMALVAPLLLVLLFGIWSVTRAYNVKNAIDDAVREGARFAATVDPWDSASADAVLAVIEAELAAAAIEPQSVAVGCIDFVAKGEMGCEVEGLHRVRDALQDQVVVYVVLEDHRLDFVFFSLDVDFPSQAMARYGS